VVWAAPGRNAATWQAFFDELTDDEKASIQAVSLDIGADDQKAICATFPDPAVASEPFHVVPVASNAADQSRYVEPISTASFWI
jgi:transposase